METFRVRTPFGSASLTQSALGIATVALCLVGQPTPASAQAPRGLIVPVPTPSRAFEGVSFGTVDTTSGRQRPSFGPTAAGLPLPNAQGGEQTIHCGIRVVSPKPTFRSNMPIAKGDASLDPKFVVNSGCSIRD
jgi:hypothetical protein